MLPNYSINEFHMQGFETANGVIKKIISRRRVLELKTGRI